MHTLLAGFLSGMISWVVNEWLIKKTGLERAVLWLVPIVEEILKSVLAVLLGGSLLYTHVLFGGLEGILDIRNGNNGLKAALYSVATHSVFGWVTAMVYQWSQFFPLAVFSGIMVHIGWNWYVIKEQ